LTNLPLGRKIPLLVPSYQSPSQDEDVSRRSALKRTRGKKVAAPLAKPAVGAALAASFRRFPAANLHQRLASAAKR
jgi:hypothetical protein